MKAYARNLHRSGRVRVRSWPRENSGDARGFGQCAHPLVILYERPPPRSLLTNMLDRPTVCFIYNVIRDGNYSREDYIMNGSRGRGSPRRHQPSWPPLFAIITHSRDSLEDSREIKQLVTNAPWFSTYRNYRPWRSVCNGTFRDH